MRFNQRELALYAASRLGKADKESCLWMKECEGILRKKESECSEHAVQNLSSTPSSCTLSLFIAYTQKWFILTGNLLFYCRTEHPVSILNRAHMSWTYPVDSSPFDFSGCFLENPAIFPNFVYSVV